MKERKWGRERIQEDYRHDGAGEVRGNEEEMKLVTLCL